MKTLQGMMAVLTATLLFCCSALLAGDSGGSRTFTAHGAITAGDRVKVYAANNTVIQAGVTDADIVGTALQTTADGALVSVTLLFPVRSMTANGAITVGNSVYPAASGKVTGSAGSVRRIGLALNTTVNDGDKVDVVLAAAIYGAPIAIGDGGTNSSTALTNKQLMVSSGGSIVELGAMTTGQIVVGSTGNLPVVATMGGDATVGATGTVTIGTGAGNDIAAALNNASTSTAYNPNTANANTMKSSVGTGTGFTKPYGVVSAQSAATGAGNGADQTEDVLFTYSLPANSLAVTNQVLKVRAFGHYATNGDNKQVKLYFGSEVVATGVVTSSNKNWIADLTVIKTGSNTQQVCGTITTDTTVITIYNAAGAETDTNAIVIKCTGQETTANTANSILCYGMIVEAADY